MFISVYILCNQFIKFNGEEESESSVFNVLQTAKAISRWGHCLEPRSTDSRIRGSNSGPLGIRQAVYPLNISLIFNCNNEFIGCLEIGVDPDQMVPSMFHRPRTWVLFQTL